MELGWCGGRATCYDLRPPRRRGVVRAQSQNGQAVGSKARSALADTSGGSATNWQGFWGCVKSGALPGPSWSILSRLLSFAPSLGTCHFHGESSAHGAKCLSTWRKLQGPGFERRWRKPAEAPCARPSAWHGPRCARVRPSPPRLRRLVGSRSERGPQFFLVVQEAHNCS